MKHLKTEASKFAETLTQTLRGSIETSGLFTVALNENGHRFLVELNEGRGEVLTVGDKDLLTMVAEYECDYNKDRDEMAIMESSISVHPGTNGTREPLFRYEFVNKPRNKQLPSAHIHVHAHRDALTATMVRAGNSAPLRRKREQKLGIPALSDLHFPVGGARFRPTLEDIIEMLVTEFGVKAKEGFRANLDASRTTWYEIQTRASVKDHPEAAVSELEKLGYTIIPPA